MVEYSDSAAGVEPKQLQGFFVGWRNPPSPERHAEILRGSAHVVLARDGDAVVGFVTAISDGALSAFIPLLEVLPDHQGRGIGTELMRRMLARLDDLYMVDLCCDAELEPFYRRFGLITLDRGMGLRR
jgi:ribosomal protein S18 acetylase RimI-like enzyme